MSKRKGKKIYFTRSNSDSDLNIADDDDDDDFVPSKKKNKVNQKEKKKEKEKEKEKKTQNKINVEKKNNFEENKDGDQSKNKKKAISFDDQLTTELNIQKNEHNPMNKPMINLERENISATIDLKSVKTSRKTFNSKCNPLQYVKPVSTPNLGIKVGLSRKVMVKHSLHPLLTKKGLP